MSAPCEGKRFPFRPALKVRHVSEHEITDREQFVIANSNGRQIAPSHDSAIEKRDELLLVGEEGGRPPWRALLTRPSSSERASASGGDAGEKEREGGGDQEKLEEAQCEDDKQ